MDLTRKVTYRGFDLNSIEFDEITRDMRGCEITMVEYGRVIGEGYTEKAAMREGRDASDIYLDQRLIAMTGNIYGRSRAEAMDLHRDLTDVLTPTDAYQDDPGQKGYLPLDFYSPTLNIAPAPEGFPSGVIHQHLNARPLATPSARFASDGQGGEDSQGLAIPWQAQLSCRDPRILNMSPTDTVLHTNHNVGGAGTIRNRGNRPAVIEVYLLIPANINGSTASGKLVLEIGGSTVTFTLPQSGSQMVLQYNSDLKVLEYNNALRMNYLKVSGGHPYLSGQKSYKWTLTSTKNLAAGSYFRFRDTWA